MSTNLVSRIEKNRVPLCCSAITEPEILRSGNCARPGPRMLGCTLGRLTHSRRSCFMFVPAPRYYFVNVWVLMVRINCVRPSLRTFVRSPVNCLFEMTVPMNLTELSVLMTFVKTVSVTAEMLTCPSSSSSLSVFPVLRWSNSDVAWEIWIWMSWIYSVLDLLTGNFKSPQSDNCNRGQWLAKYLVRDFEIMVPTFFIRFVDNMNLLKVFIYFPRNISRAAKIV